MGTKVRYTSIKCLAIALIITAIPSIMQAQNGPAGVGNSDGTNGQPKNEIWVDASTLNLANNANVSTWLDLSGNGNSPSQATTNNMPIFKTNIINGLPVVRFSPTTAVDNINRPITELPFDGTRLVNTPYSLFAIASRRTNGNTNNSNYIIRGDTRQGNRMLLWGWNRDNYHDLSQFQTNLTDTNKSTKDQFYLLSGIQRNSNTNPNWGSAIFENGSLIKFDNRTALLTAYAGAAIGHRYNESSTISASIDVAEFIVYSNALNEAQRIIVDNYLSAKYATTMTGNDYYSSTTYTKNIVGIGTTDGTVKHSETSGSGGGIYLRETNNSLDETNEFVFAGNNGAAATAVTSNLPTLTLGNLTRRSGRDWYIDRTEGTNTPINLGFKLSEVGLPAGSENTVYMLLYKAAVGDQFNAIETAIGIVNDGIAWISVDNTNLKDGYYTVAETDIEGRTWYSYRSGDWDNWLTWTLEESGGDIINPNQLTPSTSPTASIDKVVVISPYSVTVSTNVKSNAILDVKSGTIYFGSTSGHHFNTITGQGRICLTEDNFPVGNASNFSQAGGGTVEFNGTGILLETPRTFNNVEINLTESSNAVTLLANYTLNGDLKVERGILQINDNSNTSKLTLDIAEDVTITANGKITVGEGNTVGANSSINPAVGLFHNQYHQMRIGGNLLNDGSIRLTNQTAPEYANFTLTGAVTLTFNGNIDREATLNGTTDLYDLIIDKGIDKTHKLTINSSNTNNFRLFGRNNVERKVQGEYTDANPEICKALWIKNGTLELTGKIMIPTLSEGRVKTSLADNGDFTIPANGCLWINGEDVEVYSTARPNPLSPQIMAGSTGVSENGHGSISILGEFRITNGYLNTRHSGGMIFFPQYSAVVRIEGGICDIAQFRSSTSTEAVGATAFHMSGGEMYVRGAQKFDLNGRTINPDWKSGDRNDNSYTYPAFGILNPNGVFQMTGGTIYIADVSSSFGGASSKFNEYKCNGLYISTKAENHNVTGGTIHILYTAQKFDIYSSNPLYNLTITRRTGTSGEVQMLSDIALNGNLILNDYAVLRAQKRSETGTYIHSLPTCNLTVAGAFMMNPNSKYIALNNTTTLYVTNTNNLWMNGTSNAQNFFNLVIKKNPNASATRRILNGNNSRITIHNNLTIDDGATLQHSTKDILVKGNIFNSGTIELANSSNTAKVLLSNRGIVSAINITNAGSYTSIPTITIAAPPAGGTTAEAIPIFSDIPSGSNALPLEGIAIINSGSGYTTAPAITISGSGGGTATAVINTQHQIGGNGSGSFGNLEVNEVHPSETASKQMVTYLTADQKVSNIFTLTNGILDIDTYNFDVYKLSTYGNANEETNYSATKLIRTASNFSDGGLTLGIFENGTYFFPLGTYNTTSKTNRYAWAKPVISNFSDDGKLQINGVNEKLPTLSDESTLNERRYLQYYWRVRHSGFTALPNAAHQFIGYKVDIYNNLNSWNGLVTGKIVNYIRSRYGNFGPGNNNSDSRLLNFTPALALETGEYTCGRTQCFNGSIEIYYTRVLGDGYELKWDDRNNWTRSDRLNDRYSPHDSRQPAANDYPKIGDIAVIGWVPWNATQTADRGKPHGICIDNKTIEVARVEFSQMKDAAGNPVPKVFTSNFQFRPTICINETNGKLEAGMVVGEGMFWNRWSDPDFSSCDIGDFAAQDSSYMVYENDENPRTYYNIPTTVPNIMLSSDDWGRYNKTFVLTSDITSNGNFEVLGNTNVNLSTGTDGNITVKRDLKLIQTFGGIGGNSNGGGEFHFTNSANARTVTVYGNIVFDNPQGIIDVTGTGNPNTNHQLNLYGNIIQKTTTNGGLQLNVANGNHVTLNLLGEGVHSYNVTSGAIPNFYRIVMDKGTNTKSSFTFNTDFNLHGPTNGDSKTTKALELNNGMFIMNNKDIDITLSSGGADFEIPATSGLSILQGTARITATGSNGIFLDGYLGIEGVGSNQGALILDGGVASDNYIQYSSSGNAEIRVSTGRLYVGSQIRSTTENNLGVLKYMQIGKTGSSVTSEVTVGARTAPTNSRGIFEVFNPGSQFFLLNGTLNINNAHNTQNSETRAALFLDPANSSVNKSSTINIGTGTNGGTITITSAINLGIVNVNGNATAKLHVRDLGVLGDLTVSSGSAFDGSSLNLTLSSDIINRGTKNLYVDSLYFIGDEQEIDGDIEVERMFVQPTTSVTLTGETDTITVSSILNISSGTLADNARVVEVKGDVSNESTYSTTGVGHILFNGAALQHIEGTGDFGAIKLDNPKGLEANSNIAMNNNLTMTNGCLILKDNRLSLSQNSSIDGANFGGNKMIRTNGNLGDAGIQKMFTAGAFNFTFPIGVYDGIKSKYTPIELTASASSSAGSIIVHPVNQQHMTTLALGSNVLQYYWILESTGLSGFTGNAEFHYINDDVNGDESLYMAARLYDDAWAKYPHDGSVFDDDDYFNISFPGLSDISGDYTTGYDENIPATVPVFISNGNGLWTDVDKWTSINGFEVPEGGPQGHIVRIREQDTIRIDRYRVLCYKTQIYGRLETDTIGHNFGKVSGTGTLVFYNDKIFSGEYTDFIACGTGGTVEFSGGTYTIPTFNQYSTTDDQYNNLVISGTGIKSFPDRDKITICGDLSIIGSTTLKMEHWARPNSTTKLTYIKGNVLIGSNATWDMDYSEYLYLYKNFEIENGGKLNAKAYHNNLFYLYGTSNQYFTGHFTSNNCFSQLFTANYKSVLNSPVEINSTLYLSKGTVISSSINLLTSLKKGLGLYYSVSSYRGIVEGPIKLNMKPSTNSYYPTMFPVGKNSVKKFINLTSLPNAVSYYTGEYFGETTLSGGMDPEQMLSPLKTVSKVEYWSINSEAGSSIGFNLPITSGNDICQTITNLNNLRIAMWNGTAWEKVASAPSAGATRTSGTVGTTENITLTAGRTYYFTLAAEEEIVIPTAQFTTADTTICAGESVQLAITFTGSPTSTQWSVTYSNGSTETTVNNLNNTNNTITVTPTATTTYTLTNVSDDKYIGTPSGNPIGSPVKVTVIPVPTQFTVSASANSICGIQTININLNDSQRYYTYELYRNGFATGNTIAGTNNAISFTGIALDGTYTVYAYYTGRPQCKVQMSGSAIITTSSGASAIITGFATNDSICSGNAVQLSIELAGKFPFQFTLQETGGEGGNRTFNATSNTDGTITYTLGTPPTWFNQNILGQPKYITKYVYTITNVSDDSGCGEGSGTGEATLSVFKIPETGEQYHIPNNHGI